jgi:methyl-accepting chemotaxis protein
MNLNSVKGKILRIGIGIIITNIIVLIFFTIGFAKLRDLNEKNLSFDKKENDINHLYRSFDKRSLGIRGILIQSNSESELLAWKNAGIDTSNFMKNLQGFKKEKKEAELLKEISEFDENILRKIESEIIEQTKLNEVNAGQIYTSKYLEARAKLDIMLDSLMKMSELQMATLSSDYKSQLRSTSFLMIGVLLPSLVIGFYNAFATAKSLSSDLLNIVTEICGASNVLNHAIGNVSISSSQLSDATTAQAASIQETVASMEEMDAMLKQTSSSVQSMLTICDTGKENTQLGQKVVERLLNSMEQLQISNARVQGIVRLIDEIKGKTAVINEIVFETRLLSVNASIEAARAGTHGKGFSIVAEEVGKLAAMSGRAAEEIKNLLESSISEVTQTVSVTHQRLLEGQLSSKECEKSFGLMTNTLGKISNSAHAISEATREQMIGVKHTHTAMRELERITHGNAAGSLALQKDERDLSLSSQSLNQAVEKLNRIIYGGAKKTKAVNIQNAQKNGDNNNQQLKQQEVAEIVNKESIVSFLQQPSIPTENIKNDPELSREDTRWKSAS